MLIFFIPKDKYIGENLTSQNSIKIINHRKNFQEKMILQI